MTASAERSTESGWRLVAAALAVYFVIISIRHLGVVPPVQEDEPWIASTAFKLATRGVFGSDVFAGYYGMEHHYFLFPPVFPLILAGAIRLCSFGVVQLRLVTVLLATITLVLTYAVGRKLFSPAVGTIAVAFLVLVGLEPFGVSTPTGILFVDAARIARYDIAVPMFGLAALLAYLNARDKTASGQSTAWMIHLLSGFFAGLAVMTHFNALFWFVALVILAIWDRADPRSLIALAVGFALPCIPYVLYVLTDLNDWIEQTRGYAHRFQALAPMWYVRNLIAEPFRYGPGLGHASLSWLTRFGLWTSLILLPGSLVALALRAKQDRQARALAVPAILIPVLVALCITHKFRNYKVAFIPLLALAAAWGIWSLWNAAGSRSGRRWWRPAIVIVAMLIVGEGLMRAARLEQIARRTTPYVDYIARIRAHVPPGGRVLGLHNYWIGFEDTNYRTWWAPLGLESRAHRSSNTTMLGVLEAIDPDVVLMDRRMRDYLEHSIIPDDPRPGEIREWLRDWRLYAVVEDSTYGRMDIYRQ